MAATCPVFRVIEDVLHDQQIVVEWRPHRSPGRAGLFPVIHVFAKPQMKRAIALEKQHEAPEVVVVGHAEHSASRIAMGSTLALSLGRRSVE